MSDVADARATLMGKTEYATLKCLCEFETRLGRGTTDAESGFVIGHYFYGQDPVNVRNTMRRGRFLKREGTNWRVQTDQFPTRNEKLIGTEPSRVLTEAQIANLVLWIKRCEVKQLCLRHGEHPPNTADIEEARKKAETVPVPPAPIVPPPQPVFNQREALQHLADLQVLLRAFRGPLPKELAETFFRERIADPHLCADTLQKIEKARWYGLVSDDRYGILEDGRYAISVRGMVETWSSAEASRFLNRHGVKPPVRPQPSKTKREPAPEQDVEKENLVNEKKPASVTAQMRYAVVHAYMERLFEGPLPGRLSDDVGFLFFKFPQPARSSGKKAKELFSKIPAPGARWCLWRVAREQVAHLEHLIPSLITEADARAMIASHRSNKPAPVSEPAPTPKPTAVVPLPPPPAPIPEPASITEHETVRWFREQAEELERQIRESEARLLELRTLRGNHLLAIDAIEAFLSSAKSA